MEEHETEPDVVCLVCFNLRLSKYFFNEPDRFERQRKIARELSGYNPFDRQGRLFVEPQSLDATAAAGCLSCVLLKDVWGRLCHTEQLCSRKGDMEGRHGFFLQDSESRGLFLQLKDHIYLIHTMEGESCPWYAITSLPWSAFLPTLDEVRLFVQRPVCQWISWHRTPQLPVLPTRLVMLHDGRPQGDLVPVAPLEVRLIETSPIAETFDDDLRYTALSHCWGSPDVAARVLQTTTETTGAFSRSIPWGSLTKTFQDAMLVTKHLGIRYIWIDSLCIVQDDAQDWAAEASRMASVYANAHLTISAMGAADGHQGLFINTSSEPILRRGVHEIKLPGLQYPIYVRSPVSYGSAASRDPLKLTDTPLLQRGWAFQERFLSPLILHFTESELNFEGTRGRSLCECEELEHYIEGTSSRNWLSGTETSSLGCGSWYRIVKEYASRLLTSEADRLPALSGIATTFQRQLPALESYLAGLWEADILRGLHWYVRGTVQPRLRPTLARETLLSAPPTWSWASVGGSNIRWYVDDATLGSNMRWYVDDATLYSLVEIISSTCFALTSDDKGMVAGGRIALRGRLCPATLDLKPHSSTTNAGTCSITLADKSLVNNARPTFLQDVRLGSDGEALPAVYFLPLSLNTEGEPWWHLFGLVLCRETKEVTPINRVKHSSKDTATFSRVGCAFQILKPRSLYVGPSVSIGKCLENLESTVWFSEWRDTVFNNFGQEEVLAII